MRRSLDDYLDMADDARKADREDGPSRTPLRDDEFRPMGTAPTTGPVRWVEVQLRDGSVKRAHYACDLSGEEQPPFRGWFERIGTRETGFFSAVEPIAWRPLQLRDGEPCEHHGCLSHVSHPCEGCGRYAGRSNYDPLAEYDSAPTICRAGIDVEALEGLTEAPRVGLEPTTTRLTGDRSSEAHSEGSENSNKLDVKRGLVTPGLDGLTGGGGPEAAHMDGLEPSAGCGDSACAECYPDPDDPYGEKNDDPLGERDAARERERRIASKEAEKGDPEDEVDYRLRYYGDPGLTKGTQAVRHVTPAILGVFEALERIATEHKGLGLAANQIGSNACVAVMKVGDEWLRLVNPFISLYRHAHETEAQFDTLREGSLSIPGFTIRTKRARTVILAYQNEQLEDCERELVDIQARCAQHLCDQLNGFMIVGPEHSRQVRRQCERIGVKALGWK